MVSVMLFGSVPTARAASNIEIGMATGRTLLNIPDDQLQKRLLDIKRLGITWIRVDFSWVDIQPHSDNKFDFRFHDKVVIAAENLGIKVLATLAYTPAWARNVRCTQLAAQYEEAQQKCVPRDVNEFARFAREVAVRYQRHGVLAYEIWNEPNIVGYWKGVNAQNNGIWVNPEAYARLANAAAVSLREIKPTVIIVAGGLAPVFDPNDTRGMRQGDFLKAMVPKLTRGGVNAIAMHPYTWPALPSQVADWNSFYSVDQGKPEYNLRTILARAGRSDLAIWGTEYGASTVGLTNGDSTGRADHVDEPTQAEIIRQGIEDWYKKPNVGPLFTYTDSDQYLPDHRNEGGFGLRRDDGTAKPAYTTFQSVFQNTKYSAQNTTKE